MTHRHLPTKLLTALALAAMALPSANAGILGTSSSGVSLGDLASYDDSEKFTSEDLAVMRESRTEARTKIKALDIAIAEMEAKIKAGDKTATQAKLDKLKQEKADAQELIEALNTLILQAKADIKDNTPDIDTGYTDNGSGGGGGGGMGSITDMLKQAAINGLLQNMLGGNNSALNGMMNNLQTSMNNLTGGTTGGTGGYTGGPETSPTPTDETPEATDEDVKKLPDCAPAEKKDNSPGRRNAETGSVTGTKSTGSTTDTNPGKAKDDVITKPAPATRDDSGKLVKDKPKTDDKKKEEECTPVDITTKNPVSKNAGITGTGSAAMSEAELEALNGRFNGRNQECAALVQGTNPDIGLTRTWGKGVAVRGNTDIPVGTPLATFNYTGNQLTVGTGDRYTPPGTGGISGYSHTVLYRGQDPVKGLFVQHQYNGTPTHETWIPWDKWSGGSAEAGKNYYTIVRNGHRAMLDYIPLLQPTWLALKLVPLKGGLANADYENYYVM